MEEFYSKTIESVIKVNKVCLCGCVSMEGGAKLQNCNVGCNSQTKYWWQDKQEGNLHDIYMLL